MFIQCSSVAQWCQTLCNPMNRSTSGLPVHHQLPESPQTHVHESMMPSNYLFLCRLLLLLPSIFPSIFGYFPMSQFFTSGDQSIGVSVSASILPMNIQDLFPLGWIGWTPCSPRDSQESSLTPQFKSISSLVLSFLYSPTLT